jgi:hypothetical protein
MELIQTEEHNQFRKQFLSDLDKLQQKNHKVIISYFGLINTDFISQLVDTLEHYLLEHNIESSRVKKLYSISLQTLNNIFIYGKTDSENQKLGSFFISNHQDRFHVFSSNLIEKERELFLTDYLNEINNLTSDSIEKSYNTAIQKSFFSKEQNGIGIISMRYHSEKPLKYSFKNAGDKLLFCLEMC